MATEGETWWVKTEKCADSFISHMIEAVDQLIGQVRRFVQIGKPRVLELPFEITKNDCKEDRKLKILHQSKHALRVVCDLFVNCVLISVEL